MTSNVHKLAKEHGITIALKGSVNIISDGEQLAAIKRSTPAMTVGGTGDVLSGLAAGLLAKMNPFEAAVVAIYLNGLAGKDRKSTRLNSSHANISYAVFCLKKKKKNNNRSKISKQY